MKLRHISVHLQKDTGVSFKSYTFKTFLENLAPHDIVAVQTVNGIYMGTNINYVEKPGFDCKWAFQRINVEEIEFVEKLEREGSI